MSRPRLIPVVLVKNGIVVRSQSFLRHQGIGSPINTIQRLSNWNVDELVLLDISKDDFHDLRRDDLHLRYNDNSIVGLLKQISQICFMPLAVGGRIRTVEDMKVRLASGADKCVINTAAVDTPELIAEGSKAYGAQCVVVSIDVMRHADGSLEVFIEGGRKATGLSPVDHAIRCEELGAGEIIINSIDRDGTGIGYDIDLVKQVSAAVSIPVIALGGAGEYADFPKAISEGNASAAAAANIFHFFELSYPHAKNACIEAGVPMRDSPVSSKWFPREPAYDTAAENKKIEERLERARRNLGPKVKKDHGGEVRWCTSCVYPFLSATPMEFDDQGRCMGCQVSSEKLTHSAISWDERKEKLIEILEQNRCRDGSRPDCVIGVSGGKDSYFQAHVIKNELGFNPLLVTYYGNNYTAAGHRNLYRMKEVFDVDHHIHYPSVTLLKKLNRLGFTIMGDMNWHGHIGISTLPMKVAALYKIPIVVWGEHGYADLCGQFSMNDFVEWTYRTRFEHFGRGYEWNYMVGREGISDQAMWAYQYPSDQEIYDLNLRGLYLSNYVRWEANEHTEFVQKEYGWEPGDEAFERTYRRMSNLDDMHENGVHDYLKFIKFGYGRCTDHASKDIRAGRMTREEALELVKRYDHVKPKDLRRWLEYVGMSEEEFDAIADTFRDSRVWRKENGEWVKDNIWSQK